MHRPTRKNKRMMSGGGKISKITRRFKDHFKRFFKINENDKIKKCEAWGSLNGIFKFVEAQNEKYTGEDGTELSGLDKMIGNINKTPNSSNKDRYIKAIDCFKKGCDTILSGDKCVSYSDFVNSGGATTAAVEAPVVSPAPAAVAADEGDNAGQGEDAVVPAPTVTENDADEGVNAAAEAAAPKEETSTAVDPEEDASTAAAPKEETSAAVDAVQDDADSAEGTQSSDSPGVTQSGDAPEGSAATAVLDNNNNPDNTQNSSTTENTEEDASVDKSSEGGGRPRRHSRPSRRIKSRKSKKGRMTRRKHRAVRR